MKGIKLLVTLLITMNSVLGQGIFKINSKAGNVQVYINGITYQIDNNFISIETRYPSMDTVSIMNSSSGHFSERRLICNFKPDSSYTIFPACCAVLDIFPSFRLENDSIPVWGADDQYEKVQEALMDKPYFILKIINGTGADSIYAWRTDHSSWPMYKLIDESGWDYGVPAKGYYWSNINTFTFFKLPKEDTTPKYYGGVIEGQSPPEQSQNLASISVRLFDNDSYVITYDAVHKTIELTNVNPPVNK